MFHKRKSISTPEEVEAAKADCSANPIAPKTALKRSAGDLPPEKITKRQKTKKTSKNGKKGKKNARPVASDYM